MPDDKRKTPPPGGRRKDPDPTPPAADPPGPAGPFNVKTVKRLVRLMSDHDLSEIDLQDGDQRVRLRKGGAPAPAAFAPPPVAHHAPAAHAHPAAAAAAPPPPPAPAAGPKLLEIKSELIGTFYAKPKPDKDDYVKVGSKVTPTTTVCQIEAMKIFNEMPAGVSGVVREVCLKNGDFVEFGTVLFRVDPS